MVTASVRRVRPVVVKNAADSRIRPLPGPLLAQSLSRSNEQPRVNVLARNVLRVLKGGNEDTISRQPGTSGPGHSRPRAFAGRMTTRKLPIPRAGRRAAGRPGRPAEN